MFVGIRDKYPLNTNEITVIGGIFGAKESHIRGDSLWVSGRYYTYPPLFFVISSYILTWEDRGRGAANKIAWFWIILALSGMFAFMRGRFSKWQTIFGLTVAVSSPFLGIASKYLALDLGHLALFFWFLWALDKSEAFSLRKWSVIAGLIGGAGFLIRWNFQILILIPCILTFMKSIKTLSVRVSLNTFLFCLIQIIILFIYFQTSGTPPGAGIFREKMFPDFWSYWSIFLYPYILFHSMLGTATCTVVTFGIVVGLYKNWKTTLYLVLTAAAILAVSTVFPTKNFRYIYLIPPLLAILAAFLWSAKRPAWNLFLILVLCAGNLGATNYMDGEQLIPRNIGESGRFYVHPVQFYGSNWDQLSQQIWSACDSRCRIFLFDFSNGSPLNEFDYTNGYSLIAHHLEKPGILFDREIFKNTDQFSQEYRNILIFPDSEVTPQLKSLGKSTWYEIETLRPTPPNQFRVIIVDR